MVEAGARILGAGSSSLSRAETALQTNIERIYELVGKG